MGFQIGLLLSAPEFSFTQQSDLGLIHYKIIGAHLGVGINSAWKNLEIHGTGYFLP